jgi:hypothetical protein
MDRVAVEGSSQRVTCGAGVRVYQANQATVSHGLALPLGICGDVGVAGLTLGGEERVREAYGDNYSRAVRLKKKYDPEFALLTCANDPHSQPQAA